MIDFFDEQPVFRPEFCAKKLENCPSVALITWHPGIFNAAKAYGAKRIWTFFGGTAQEVYSISYKSKRFVLAHIAQGGPNVAPFMEELHVLGVNTFVFLGSAGLLDPGIGTKLIVPTKALRDEGVSYHYTADKDEFINIPSSEILISFLEKNNIPFVSGPTWTTDAAYRETPSAVKYATQRGCLCVEMECASLMAVAQYMKTPCFQLLYSADKLSETEWDCFRHGKFDKDTNNLYSSIALDFCINLQDR